ncbi:MAG: hypothetical protein ACP5Q5_09225 [Brevinematia bacterium]
MYRIILFLILYSFIYSFEYKNTSISIYLYGNTNNFKKVVWIFPGYIDTKDSYSQLPTNIIEKWKLNKISNEILFLFPYKINFVYPLYEGKNISRWIFELDNFRNLILKNKSYNEVFIGISTGVEGAIKFNINRKNGIFIFLSGTYDYFILDKKSGEYKIHEKFFANDNDLWKKENPLYILKDFKGKIHIFCEKNSIYFKQQKRLFEEKFQSLDVIPEIIGGENTFHNWEFWSSEKVVKRIEGLVR